MRSVSLPRLVRVLSPAISQNRCPNSESGLKANSDGLRSFSMRIVARPENGDALLVVGVVEYSAKIESLAHGLPAGRHTVATYCGRSDTSKISTRENGVLVKYSSPAPPPPWLLKMASPMWLPPGSARVMPATTVTVSARLAASGTPPTCENAQLRATARSQAYPSTTTRCGSVLGGSSAPRLRLNVRTTSVRLPADTSSESNRNVAPARSRTRNPIHEMALGSVACTRIVSFASTRLVTL